MKRYVGNTGQVYIMDEGRPSVKTDDLPVRNVSNTAAGFLPANLRGTLGSLLRKPMLGFEMGDIAILALLFFLYKESGDEEFLIVLAFFALGIFGK